MNRRKFVKNIMSGGLGAAALPTLGGNSTPSFVQPEPIGSFELAEATISDLRDGMKSGKWTTRAIVEKYLERIEALNRKGPAVNAVIELNPEALDIAERCDRERKTGGEAGPLHGIPVLIKDNIDTADRMATTAGSLALVGGKPKEDAFIVKRLREAGAVILGKTNLSEWANFRSRRSVSGWSGRGGQTRNPYALDRNPSGSSSGSAVAVAADFCAVAVGTETDGSIVSPASRNSIVGIKPTLGLVSRSGIIPIAHSQDTAGPMARTVKDAALLLGVLAGLDSKDAASTSAQGKIVGDYARFCDPNGLKGARIGVARQFFGLNDRVNQVIAHCLDAMKRAGAELIDPVDLPTAGQIGAHEIEVLQFEFKADLNAYLAGLGPEAPIKNLKDLIDFNLRKSDLEMPFFGQEWVISSEAKGPLTDPKYLEALEKGKRLAGAEGIDAVMTKHKLDAVVAPSGGPPWLIDWVNGDSGTGGCSGPAAVAGYPHVTLPAGYVFGLPVGISLFGSAFSEPTLIRLAFALEHSLKVRRPPRFPPTADLWT